MAQTATNMSSRELALARRRALSSVGKTAVKGAATTGAAPVNTAPAAPARVAPAAAVPAAQGTSARKASRARRESMSTSGKAGIRSTDRTRSASQSDAPAAPPATPSASAGKPESGCGCGCKQARTDKDTAGAVATASPVTTQVARQLVAGARPVDIKRSAGRVASLARRQAMSVRGKAGVSAGSMSLAQAARAGNPNLSSRELSQTIREQRSRNGRCSEKKSSPCGRVRPKPAAQTGASEDAPWKVGASETTHGQTVTGTMVGRSHSVTGDEPSTCRGITGTEYLGADIFRDFCQSDPGAAPR
ncbi:MAG: CsoS2 family carboxysome shell protein, partial [Gammaproteobacteria bacterium]